MTDRHAAEAREKARQEKNVYKRRALQAEARNAELLVALEYWIPLREIIQAANSSLLTEALCQTEAAIIAAKEE